VSEAHTETRDEDLHVEVVLLDLLRGMRHAEQTQVLDQVMPARKRALPVVLHRLEVPVREPHDDVLCRCRADVAIVRSALTAMSVPGDDEYAYLVHLSRHVEDGRLHPRSALLRVSQHATEDVERRLRRHLALVHARHAQLHGHLAYPPVLVPQRRHGLAQIKALLVDAPMNARTVLALGIVVVARQPAQ
jgi:hypothetical protein